MKRYCLFGLLAASMCLLTGCQNLQKTLGFSRTMPEAYLVDTVAPLTVPPHFHLRPPLAEGSGEASAFGSAANPSLAAPKPAATPAERALKQRTQHTAADAETRRVLEQEAYARAHPETASQASREKPSWWKRTFNRLSNQPATPDDAADPSVNAVEESKRMRGMKEEGGTPKPGF